MIKLTIIIPIYNVEAYVGRCIESCLKQDLEREEYELLIINDGSLDGSMDVVRQHAQQYDNIRIIEQKNAGPSVARNHGIQDARGEYLWFIDSDDDISENVLKTLVDAATNQNLDVLCFDINVFEHGCLTFTHPKQSEKNQQLYTGIEFISEVGMPPSGCVALYKKDFLIENSLSFINGISHEDYEFTPRAYCLAKRIAYVNVPAYNYWVREGSRQTSTKSAVIAKKAKDWLVICDSLYQFTKKHLDEGTPAYRTMIGKINFAFSQSLRNYTKGGSTIAEYKKKPYYPLDISVEGEKRNRWKYRLINLSIPIYLLMHKMFKR